MGFFSRIFNMDTPQAEAPTTIAASAKDDVRLDSATAEAILAEIDIDTAIAAHENWKVRLQNYLNGKSDEELKAEVVCLDDRCALGQWLHGPGRMRLGSYPAFSVLIARHKYFHMQASTVLALSQAGDKTKAAQLLDGGYRHASNQVMLMLRALKRELAP